MNKTLEFFNNFPFISFLKGQWINLWDWVKLAHSQNDEASSKRLYGGLTILVCLTSFMLFSAGVFTISIWTVLAPYWTFLLIFGAGLLSISTLEKIATIIANFKVTALLGTPKTEVTEK